MVEMAPACQAGLAELQIPLLPRLDSVSEENTVLSTAQMLLLRTYECLVPVITGAMPEKIKADDQDRLAHPQAFVEATMALLDAYAEKLVDRNQPPITVRSALAIGSLVAQPELPKTTLEKAQKIVNDSPTAGLVLAGLRTLQAPPTK